ncbi:pigment epithelium-derived factor [Rhinatrema bivittatum]|uniref:pigment epithelium-derived factor n=1 Tax=Rhinatrema bivittatum TaxID=194408 RepID=UPI00112C32BD|nr:pigment epithelium-derived factor [Rhinatrema bivittatum]
MWSPPPAAGADKRWELRSQPRLRGSQRRGLTMKSFLFFLCIGSLLCPSSTQDAERQEESGPADEEDPFYKSPVNKLAAAASNFGYDLYRQQASKNPTASILMSPLSVATVLSSLSLGAEQRTESLIHRALFYDLLNNSEVHATYKELIAALQSPEMNLKTASRILLERKLRPKLDFLNLVEKFYGARPKVLSGNPRLDLQDVNSWVQQQTGGKILKFLKEIPSQVNILLLSAAAFRGHWASKFDQKLTTLRTFQLDEQRSIRVPMMSAVNTVIKYGLDSDFDCKIVQLPLTGGISIMFFLPNEVTQNLTLIEEGLTSEFVHDIAKALHPVSLVFSMPKLKLSYEADLGSTLQEMRLRSLFSSPTFTSLSARPSKLSQVKHKAMLELSEEGAGDVTSPGVSSHLTFSLDYHMSRPFLFVTTHDETGALLFIGKVMDPRG